MRTAVGVFQLTEARDVIRELGALGCTAENIQVLAQDAGIAKGKSFAGLEAHIRNVSPDYATTLARAGVPQNLAESYLESVKKGNALVTASVPDDKIDDALRIMNSHIADTGSSETGKKSTSSATGDAIKVDVVQEELQVGKREVERGGVRVRAVVTERPVQETVQLRDETVTVERHAVNRPATVADGQLFRDVTFEMREVDQEAVVAKQARVVEEVVVKKATAERTETIRENLRRKDVEVEQLAPERRAQYESHFKSTLTGSGATFDQYTPAYRYGSALRTRSKGNEWSAVESDARRDWESHNPGTWEKVKDAVRHAWEKATS